MPATFDQHRDDSYGACVICREYVPHTEDDFVTVAWPCAVVRLAAERARIRAAVEGMPLLDYSVTTYVDGGKGKPVPYMAEADYYVKRAAVLAIIDREDTDATD